MANELAMDKVLDSLSCGVFILDGNRNLIHWNTWMMHKSGLQAEDCIGRNVFELFPELPVERWKIALDDAIDQALPSIMTRALNDEGLPLFSKPLKNDGTHDVLDQTITITPLALSDEKRGCLVQVTDVSGVVRRERALEHQVRTREQSETLMRDSESRFRDFANAASDWLWETDSDHRFTYFSERFDQALGASQKSAIGKTREEMLRNAIKCAQESGRLHECTYDQEAWDNHLQCLAEHRPFRHLEYPLFDDVGQVRYVRVSGVPVFDDGIFYGYRGTATDITEALNTKRALEQTRADLQTLVDHTPAKIHIKSKDGKYLLANTAVADLIGTTPSAMIGRRMNDFILTADAVDYERHDLEVIESGKAATQEEIFYKDDGQKTFLTVKFPMRDVDGAINAVGAVGIDVTELKMIEREAKSQSLLFQSLLDNAPFLVHIKDIDGGYSHINKYSRNLFGLGDRDVSGLMTEDLFPQELARQFSDHDKQISKDNDQEIRLHRYLINDVEKVFLVTKFYQYDLDDNPCGIVSIGTDVSDEIAARSEAEKSRALLMDAINSLPQGFVLYDANERLVLWNKSFEDLYSSAAHVLRQGITFEELTHELMNRGLLDDSADTEAWLATRMQQFRSHERGVELHMATGQWQLHDDLPTSDGGTVGIRTDISLLKNREHDLNLSQKRLQSAQAIAHLGSWEWHAEDDRMIWSDEMFRICGYEPGEFEPTYASYLNLLDPQMKESVAAIASGEGDVATAVSKQEVRLRLMDGTDTWAAVECAPIEEDGHVIGLHGTVQDITHSKTLEAQLLQATKMSALGETAAGLAHEMSQPLAVTRFAVEGLMRRLKLGAVDEALIIARLETIDGQMERMGKLIDQIRIFIRNEEQNKEVFDPVRSVNLSISMLQPRLTKENIELSIVTGVEGAKLYGAKIQFEQVIINLVNNAAHAISELQESVDGGGKIEINVDLAPDDDGTIIVAVTDSGGGIAQDTINHVFDPFFTTKSAGTGTGLGLSICSQIVKGMGGHIAVENVDKGARFSIRLPVHNGNETVKDYDHVQVPSTPEKNIRKANILVIDDEQYLRDQMADFFTDNGMDVFVADSAEQGKIVFANQHIDLVVTDLYMPGVGGSQLVTELRATHPDLPIIVLTGHIGAVRGGSNHEVVGASYTFAKPVRPSDIWEKVCELLGGKEMPQAAIH